MGQGKRWSSEESAHLAEAWIHASEGVGEVKVKGASQDGNEFWGKVLEEFGRKAPANAAPGTYLKRENKGGETRPPIENHFRDKIQRDCKKFNSSLRKVLCSNPTGCSEQERINMAVAIHLGKSDSMSYRHKGFEPNDWLFYQAWLVLKSHRAFLPPTPPPPDEDIEEIEDDEDSDPPSDTAQALFTTPKVATASDTSDDSDMQPSKQRSRGPGYGVKKRKALKKQEEYRAKKYKTQQEFLEIQRQRRDNFRVYVDNKSRHDAFKMAVMGYNAFKDHDPEQGEYYKQQMERILGNAVPDDTVIEYRAKRHKTQQEFLEIQRQRSDNFRVYVDNKSRHDAFKMAVMGYNALKDHDPEQGEYYKQQMEHILGNAVPDDTVIEYRAKKHKTQQEFLEIQRQRSDNFRVYVDNKTRHDAFKMAVMGYNALKDHDPEQGEYYKQQMERILGNAVPDDTVIEYRAKKHKTQQEFLEIQRQCNDNFRVYVDNKSRHDAFKMAVMGYNALKDHDPEQGEYYKQQMERILGNAVPDDTVIEYRAKKHKTQQEFLEIQRQCSDNFRVYVDNKSRHDAFKMAVMGYNALKDHDPEQAEYYKQQMERILGNAVPDDTVIPNLNGIDNASQW